jgi:hypothetical protein
VTYDRPEIQVNGYRLVYEDIDSRPTDGIPVAEVSELTTFLRDAIPLVNSASNAASELRRELMQKEKPDEICVTISHRMRPHIAFATYHLRIFTQGKILLDCQRDRVEPATEGRESAYIEGSTYQAVGKLEPTNIRQRT